MHSYELHLHKLSLDPDHNQARDVLMATGLEPTVSKSYKAYLQVFSEADPESMPSYVPHNVAIKLVNGK
jgi:hypothetical protein